MVKDFLVAIGNFNKYGELSKRSWGKVILYTVVLVLIGSIFIAVIPSIGFSGRIIDGLVEVMPDFTVTQDGLIIAEPFEFELQGMKVLMTNEKEVTEEDFGQAVQGFLLDSGSIYIMNMGRVAKLTYEDFNIDGAGYSFSKSDLPKMKSFMTVISALASLMMVITLIISYFLNAMFISAIAIVMTMFMNMHRPTGEIIKMALYSKTLPFVLTAILAVFGISLSGVVSLVLSLVLMYLALRSMSGENVNENGM